MATLQVRDVPDDVLEGLKRKAAARDLSLSEYLRGIFERESRLTASEWIAGCLADEPADLGGLTGADLVRLGREANGRP